MGINDECLNLYEFFNDSTLDRERVVRKTFLNPVLDPSGWDKVNVVRQFFGHGNLEVVDELMPFVLISLSCVLVTGCQVND